AAPPTWGPGSSPWRAWRAPSQGSCLRAGPERERDRVDAVALAGRRRAVVEHVPEVAAAARAVHLVARHAERVVLADLDAARLDRLPEARPAGAALELRARAE